MKVTAKLKHSDNKTERFLEKALKTDLKKLDKIAERSLQDFINASPNENVANSWSYEIISDSRKVSLFFNNSYIQNGVNIAIVIDVGHGTSSGKYVEGLHYLDEPTQKAYDRIIEETWEALIAYE